MLQRTYLLIIFTIVNHNFSNAQNNTLFSELNDAQKNRLQQTTDDWEQRESVFKKFNVIVKKTLKEPMSCLKTPDSSYHYFLVNQLNKETNGQALMYSFVNTIVITTKENLKVYSWDDLDGGSHHTYVNYIQYQNNEGICKAILLNDLSNDFNAAGYYNIEKINEYYLLFGYGTYGGGEQHFVVRIFKNDNGEIKEYIEGYPNKKMLLIGCNRGNTIDLHYNKEKQTISFNQYIYDEEKGFYKREFQKVIYQIKDGKLVKNN